MAGLLINRYFNRGKTPPNQQERSEMYQTRLWLDVVILSWCLVGSKMGE